MYIANVDDYIFKNIQLYHGPDLEKLKNTFRFKFIDDNDEFYRNIENLKNFIDLESLDEMIDYVSNRYKEAKQQNDMKTYFIYHNAKKILKSFKNIQLHGTKRIKGRVLK